MLKPILTFFTSLKVLTTLCVLALAGFTYLGLIAEQRHSVAELQAMKTQREILRAFQEFQKDHGTLTNGLKGTNLYSSHILTSQYDVTTPAEAKGKKRGDKIVIMLSGYGHYNKTKKNYLDLPDHIDLKNGYTRDPKTNMAHGIVDPWGNPYHILLDINLDHKWKRENPKMGAYAGELLNFGDHHVGIISGGPNGKLDKVDDIVSWSLPE